MTVAKFTIDPVTGIVIPKPSQEPGPLYATDVSNALLTLAHLTHTGQANSDGYQIPSAGINFNADLSAQNNDLTNLRSTRFTTQSAPLSGVGDLNTLYVSGGNLYFNNGGGTQVEIVAGSAVNVQASNNYSTKEISNNYTINATDGYVVFNCTTTSNTILITLPVANTVPNGRFYLVKDKSGNAATHNITIQTAGDTMDGGTSKVINYNYGAVGVMSDGVGNWSVWQYDKTIYNAGDTLTFDGSTLSVAASSTLTIDSTSVTSIAGPLNLTGALSEDGLVLTGGTTTLSSSNPKPIIYCRTSTGSIYINLPQASSVPRMQLTVKDIDGYAVAFPIHIVPHAADNIEGLSSHVVLNQNFQSVDLSNATAYASNYWAIIRMAHMNGVIFTDSTVPGGYNFQVPAGITSMIVRMCGGGGGGGGGEGGGTATSTRSCGGGGGGAALLTQLTEYVVVPGTTYNAIVGAGGSGGAGGAPGGGGYIGANGSSSYITGLTINALGGSAGRGGSTGDPLGSCGGLNCPTRYRQYKIGTQYNGLIDQQPGAGGHGLVTAGGFVGQTGFTAICPGGAGGATGVDAATYFGGGGGGGGGGSYYQGTVSVGPGGDATQGGAGVAVTGLAPAAPYAGNGTGYGAGAGGGSGGGAGSSVGGNGSGGGRGADGVIEIMWIV